MNFRSMYSFFGESTLNNNKKKKNRYTTQKMYTILISETVKVYL